MMAHGDAREGKWRGNWWMEWVASTLHTTSEHGVSNTPRLPVVDWTDAPTDLNGRICFVERRNLFSARVPSHFTCSLLTTPQRHSEKAGCHQTDCSQSQEQEQRFRMCASNWYCNDGDLIAIGLLYENSVNNRAYCILSNVIYPQHW